MAKNTDHFIKAISAPPTKLSSAINDTSTNIFLESLEGIQSDTAVVIVIDRVNGDGVQTPELTEVVIGTIGTNGLENVVRGVGGRQQAHKTGAVVEVSIASSEQWNRLISALLKTHNQDGTLKLGQINNEHLVDGAVDNKKIKPKGINGDRLADNSVDGRVLSSGAVKPEHFSDNITKLSTAERIVGKWIDSKPIYEKVITFSNLDEININDNFETIIKMECIIKSNEGQWRNLPWLYGQNGYVDSSWHGGFYLRPDRKIVFQTGSNISKIVYGHIILRYTKN